MSSQPLIISLNLSGIVKSALIVMFLFLSFWLFELFVMSVGSLSLTSILCSSLVKFWRNKWLISIPFEDDCLSCVGIRIVQVAPGRLNWLGEALLSLKIDHPLSLYSFTFLLLHLLFLEGIFLTTLSHGVCNFCLPFSNFYLLL